MILSWRISIESGEERRSLATEGETWHMRTKGGELPAVRGVVWGLTVNRFFPPIILSSSRPFQGCLLPCTRLLPTLSFFPCAGIGVAADDDGAFAALLWVGCFCLLCLSLLACSFCSLSLRAREKHLKNATKRKKKENKKKKQGWCRWSCCRWLSEEDSVKEPHKEATQRRRTPRCSEELRGLRNKSVEIQT